MQRPKRPDGGTVSDPQFPLAALRDSIRRAAEATDDPFEAFNAAQGMGAIRDPYPIFAAMREAAPVHRIDLEAMGGGALGGAAPAGARMMAPAGGELWLALSHDAVSEVLRDDVRFSSNGYAASMGQVMGHSILEMDGAEHTRIRNLINRAFSRRALERWERELVRPVVEAYVDRFCERGSADLVRELTFPFPVRVIAGMLGVAEQDFADFHRWAIELISVMIDWERALEASAKLGALFGRLVEERRSEPRGDLLSLLASAEVDGSSLDDEAIFAFGRLLAPAGAETTYRSSSNLLFGLLSHPEQLEALRADRTLLPGCIEEGLRWEPPLLTIMRTATCETKLCGTAIPEGAPVSLNLGSANRDPAHWEEPDRFDVFREEHPHMAFAFGRHLCLGQHLARMEMRVVLETLLDRLPGLRLDPDAEDVHVTGMVFRAPLSLPVRFDPTPAR
jgi:cytochrome P450